MGLSGFDWDGISWRNDGGMLGGQFVLKQGQVSRQRIDGQEAVVLAPGTILEFRSPVLDRKQEHTATVWVYRNGNWTSESSDRYLTEGGVRIQTTNEPLVLTNFRYYNWKQEEVEKAYDATTGLVRMPASDRHKQGLLVSLTADDYQAGDTVAYIPNKGVEGYFELQERPMLVKEIAGKKAFHFEGNQYFRSSFMLPATMRDNAPYTLEAWVLNDSIAENECVADFTSSHDELEKIMLVNGTEPRCGVLNHYGWYEDVGYPEIRSLTNQWQHIYVTFDGRMERVYINGKLISERDIQILVKPIQFVTLGRNAENNWPFTGYLHSLKLWDEYLSYEDNK